MIMLWLMALLLILASTKWSLAELSQLVPNPEITHLFFLPSELIYISLPARYFGLSYKHSGQLKALPQLLQKHQQLLRINKEPSIVIKTHRDKMLWSDLAARLSQQIFVQLPFKHQQIMDVAYLKQKFIVMTQKDIRIYLIGQPTHDTSKRVFNSAIKTETFKKIFLQEGQKMQQLVLVLTRGEMVCVRVFIKSKRGKDVCPFNTTQRILSVQRTQGYYVVQTKTTNYVIADDLKTVFTIQGRILQIHNKYVVVEGEKTYSLHKQMFFEGIAVTKTGQKQFWLNRNEQGLSLIENGKVIGSIAQRQKVSRAWLGQCHQKCEFQLVIQYQSNKIAMYQYKDGTFSQLWPSQVQQINDQL